MSADQQRLNSAIQRISEQSPRLRALLEANDNKGGKPGSVGIGVSEAEETRICCDGSTSGNANPGSTETDPDGDGSGQDGGLNGDDPALLDNGAGTLSGVTDCATGEPVCFDGAGFIPPDGWDGPSDPPLVPEYESGTYFSSVWNLSTYYGLEPSSIKSTICSEYTALEPLTTSCFLTGGGDFYQIRARSPTEYQGDILVANVQRQSCASSYNSVCDDDPPVAESWPSDSCVNLSIAGGKIVGSKYDPENDGSYSAPVQELEVCDAVTGDRILLRVDTNSTYKSIKSLAGDIDPDTQAGYLYETGTGRRIRQISPNEFRDPTV